MMPLSAELHAERSSRLRCSHLRAQTWPILVSSPWRVEVASAVARRVLFSTRLQGKPEFSTKACSTRWFLSVAKHGLALPARGRQRACHHVQPLTRCVSGDPCCLETAEVSSRLGASDPEDVHRTSIQGDGLAGGRPESRQPEPSADTLALSLGARAWAMLRCFASGVRLWCPPPGADAPELAQAPGTIHLRRQGLAGGRHECHARGGRGQRRWALRVPRRASKVSETCSSSARPPHGRSISARTNRSDGPWGRSVSGGRRIGRTRPGSTPGPKTSEKHRERGPLGSRRTNRGLMRALSLSRFFVAGLSVNVPSPSLPRRDPSPSKRWGGHHRRMRARKAPCESLARRTSGPMCTKGAGQSSRAPSVSTSHRQKPKALPE